MKYTVEGNSLRGYAVIDPHGAIEYDNLETKALADEIAEVLNDGGDYPTWESVEAKLRGETR